MKKNRRFLIGAVIILAALSYMIYGGMQEAIVYFVTPSELKAKDHAPTEKFLRMGGMVVKGSMKKDLATLTYRFDLTDGGATFPVFFKGVPPDLLPRAKAQWSKAASAPTGSSRRRRSWPSTPKIIARRPTASPLRIVSFRPRKPAPSDSDPGPYLNPTGLVCSALRDRQSDPRGALGTSALSGDRALRHLRPIYPCHLGGGDTHLRARRH